MALSPKGDPQRPLQLAIRTTRSLGALFLVLGGCASIPLFIEGFRAPAPGAAAAAPSIWRSLFSLLFYLGPGILYLVFSIFLARRRLWALIATMALAGVQVILMAIAMAVLLVMLSSFAGGAPSAMVWIPLAIMVVLIAAIGQLIYYCARSFPVIRQPLIEQQRGFEPLQVTAAMIEPTMIAPSPLPLDELKPGDANGDGAR